MFNQIQNTPLRLNPALTGLFDGNNRIAIIYGNQQTKYLVRDDYNVYNISFDTRVKISKGNHFGIGFNGFQANAKSGDHHIKQASILGNYIMELTSTEQMCQFLSIGVELGVAERSVNIRNPRWRTQREGLDDYPPLIGDGWASSIEPLFNHFELGLGINWNIKYLNGSSLQVGTAVHHLNRSDIPFIIEEEARLNRRYSVHINSELPLNNRLSILPNFIYLSQEEQQLYQVGIIGKWRFDQSNKTKAAQLGMWYRTGDDLTTGFNPIKYTFYTSLEFKELMVGFSYDHSPLRKVRGTVPGNNGIELFIQYRFDTQSKLACN